MFHNKIFTDIEDDIWVSHLHRAWINTEPTVYPQNNLLGFFPRLRWIRSEKGLCPTRLCLYIYEQLVLQSAITIFLSTESKKKPSIFFNMLPYNQRS